MNTRSAPRFLIVFSCLFLFAGLGKMWGQQTRTSAKPPSFPVITRVSDILALSEKVAGRGHPVRIRGVVTFYGGSLSRPGHMVLFVQDFTNGIYVEVPSEDLGLTAGDLVEVKGVTGHGWFTNQIETPEIHVLGRAPLPVPRRPRYEELALGQQDSHWVEITGIVHSTQIQAPSKRLILSLAVGLGRVTVAVQNYPEGAPTKLLDSKIQVQGACGGIFNPKHQLVGIVLNVQEMSSVRVLEPSTLTAETPPVASIRELSRLSAQTTSGHRLKVRGIVTFQKPFRSLYIKDVTESLKVETSQSTALQPGDTVEVWGFPALGKGSIELEDAEFRKLASGPPPVPADVTVAEALQGNYDSSLVRVQGRMFELLPEGDPPALVVESGQVAFQAQVLGKGAKAALTRLEVGSHVRITGVCEVLAEENGAPPAFRLLVRSPLDVEVLEKTSWWNLRRMRNVLGLMGALMLATAAWVIILRKQVRAKTEEMREWLRRMAALKERYRDLLENAIDMVYTRDLQGNFTSVNNTALRVLGYTRQESLRMNIAQVVAPEYREFVRQAVDRAVEGEAYGGAELEIVTKYGARVAVEIHARLLYEDGKIVGVQGIARNVTERKQVEQQVRLQAAALEAAAIGIVITGRDGNILWVNPAFTALSGYPLAEAIGKNPRLLKSGKHDSEFYRNMWNTILSGREWRGEIVNRRRDGTFYDEELTITPVRQASGEITHFVAIGYDISARKQAEETRAQLAAIVESSNDAISGTSPQGTIVSWNRGAEVLYGYRPEEVLGKHVSILAPPGTSDEISQLVKQIRQGERITNLETVRAGKDGRRIPVSLSLAPLKNARGEVVGSAAIARDITQRLQAEEALRQSEERYRSIVLNIPDVVWTIDSQGRFVFISPNIERLSGYTAEDLYQAGMDLFLQTVHPDEVQAIKETLEAAFRDHQPRDVEYRTRRKDGRWIWVRARAIGAYEKDGVQYLQGLVSDITERKQAEQSLRESQSRLQAIVDSVQTGIVIIDPKTHQIVDVNPVALELIGAPRGQVVGAECHKFICPAARGRCPVSDLGQMVDNSERVLLTASGARREIIKTVVPVVIGGRQHLLESFIDITARKQAEEELRANRHLLRTTLDSLRDAVFVIYLESSEILDCNPAATEMFGYRREEMVGKNTLMLHVDADARAEFRRQLFAALAEKGYLQQFEFRMKRKDGAIFSTSQSVAPLHDKQGQHTGWVSLVQDITERQRTERELRLTQFSVEHASDAVFWMNSQGRIVYVNEAACRSLGQSREELLSLSIPDIDPDFPKEAWATFWEEIKPRGSMTFETRHRTKQGRFFSVEITANYLEFDGKEYSFAFARDITERKRTEEALRESEEGLAAAQRIAHIGSWHWNLQTKIASWSNETFRIFGLASCQVEERRKALLDMIHPADKMRVDQAITDALNGTGEYDIDFRIQLPDGTEKVIHNQAEVLRDEGGKPLSMRGTAQDITERKRVEAALRDSEQRYREFISRSIEAVWRVELDHPIPANLPEIELVRQILQLGYVAECNDALARQLGFNRAGEVIGKHLGEWIQKGDEARLATFLSAAEGNFQTRTITFKTYDAKGNPQYLLRTEMPVVQDGMLIRAWGITRDITKLRLAEEALKESEERYRSLFENATVGIYRTTPAGQILMANPALVMMLGYKDPKELVARNLEEQGFEPTYPRQVFHERIAREGEVKGLETVWTRQDGSAIFVRESARAIRGEGNQILYYDGIVEDITERKQAEKALEERTVFFNALIENSPLAIVAMDIQGRVTIVNPAFQALFQYNPEEIVGSSLDRLVAIPEQLAAAHANTERNVTGETLHVTGRRRRKDGTIVDVELHAVPLWIAGEIVGAIGLYQDISERKKAEEEEKKAKEAAEAANRAKSEFLANMSHELRTPMNAVIGMTELALATDLDPEQRNYLELVESSADSLLKLINHILDFSKFEAGKFELSATPFILADVLEEALRPLAIPAYRKGLELACAMEPTLPSPLVGDPVRLKQIVVNLVENAIKFTEQGEVVVRAWVESMEETDMALHIAVADTGVGIPADKIEMVFEAFAQVDGSLTRRFEGAGLGLAICSELVRMMGGSIYVESKPGRGSTFHVTVRLGLPTRAISPPDEVTSNFLRGVPILVVDDHAASREILADILRHRGMVPTIVDGAEAALAAIREAQNSAPPFRLALFDAQMPGSDGFALAEQSRRIPGFRTPILMMVPPTDVGHDATRCRELDIVDYCTKPVRESDLVKAMVKALEASTAGNASAKICGSSQELGRALRILLAESNEVSQVLVTHLLEKRGHQVSVAADGLEVLAAIQDVQSEDFDLVLMDTEMPGMNGLEATRAIREIERKTGRRLPVVALTAHPMPSEEEACRAAGMEGYLAKPPRASALFEIIQRVANPPDSAAPAGPPPQTVFDKSCFLSRLEGDELLGREIIEMFLQECPKLLGDVRQAAEERNASWLERAAHTLKGSVGDMAAPQAFDAARTLEMMAKEEKFEDADAALRSLEVALRRLVPELRKLEKKPA